MATPAKPAVARRETVESEPYRDQPAQRLWLLERPAALSPDIYRFAAAVAVLDAARVYVVMVKSADMSRADEMALRRGRLRLLFERSAASFETLDEALAWADTSKRVWLGRGWTEVPANED